MSRCMYMRYVCSSGATRPIYFFARPCRLDHALCHGEVFCGGTCRIVKNPKTSARVVPYLALDEVTVTTVVCGLLMGFSARRSIF